MHIITDKELLENLKCQNDFLAQETDLYFKGKPHFALKMASTLRTIFHNTDKSKAILPAFSDKHGIIIQFKGKDQGRIVPGTALYTGFTIGDRVPDFSAPFFINKNFEDYWTEIVYVEGSIRYTRKQIILWAANKLGGSHVDPKIPDELLRLIDGSSHLVTSNYGEETIMNQVVFEMAIQVLSILDKLIPILNDETK